MTLAQKIKTLRTERRLSFGDIGQLTGLERSTVWKIEKGFLPRGDTLERVCRRGFGLRKDSKEWREIIALWTAERTGQPVTAQELAGQISANILQGRLDVGKFLIAASKIPEKDFVELSKAVRRPAVLRGLAALNALYEVAQAESKKR